MTLIVNGEITVGSTTVCPDLVVEPGEVVAVVGPNGAGKTSVLHAIAGLLRLDAGRIDVDGRCWDDGTIACPAAERSVGAVFQGYRLFDHLTAVENVAFGLRARGANRREARASAAAALDRFGVGDVAERHPRELSGGQQQRVAMARALVTQPRVVLLDEPFAALDIAGRATIRREVAEWLDGTDAYRIIVTHDPVDAHALADRVVVIEDGAVTQTGTMEELAAAPRSAYVADLIGTNFLRGNLRDGRFTAAEDGQALTVGAHPVPDGPVFATIRPAAIALHRDEPQGSPRNVWRSSIESVDTAEGRVRVRLNNPLPLVVEVTGAGFAALDTGVGGDVWASVKASEIDVVADA